ncbi:MAG: transporter [Tannerellaceae bacterium]|nr:transporter [Tannerellaceae bacterium]
MLQFIKNWMLPLAMVTGVLAWPWVSRLAFITPVLIFLMLLLTFSKLSPREIKIQREHIWLLVIQIVGSVLVYGILYYLHPVIAQGAMVCVLAPTATAAAVIAGLLGGSVAFLTSYLLVCNVAVAIAAPLLFSFIGVHQGIPFIESFGLIGSQVAPILLLPLLIAWFIRYTLPSVQEQLVKIRGLSFYLWAAGLTIVTGSTVKFLLQEELNYTMVTILAGVSLIICVSQFLLGRRIGWIKNDPVSSGQGLGQKNTILAIWMAQVYLNPVSSIAPAAYVLWQNSINSYQLWLKAKKREGKAELIEIQSKILLSLKERIKQ